MKTETKYWPFLVTRNRRLDYRTIVAPDFLARERLSGLLSVSAENTMSSHITSRLIETPTMGTLTLHYRVAQAILANDSLFDTFGRPVYLIEGVVVQGDDTENNPPIAILDRAHDEMLEPFAVFWDSETPPPVVRSHPLSHRLEKITPVLTREPAVRPKPTHLTAAVTAGAAVAFFFLAVLEYRSTQSTRQMRLSADSVRARIDSLSQRVHLLEERMNLSVETAALRQQLEPLLSPFTSAAVSTNADSLGRTVP